MDDSDDVRADEQLLARRGRMFKLRIQRNHAARQDALASIRPIPGGRWQARIGGRLRGRTETFPSYASAVRAVNSYYSERALEAALAINRKTYVNGDQL